MRHFAPVTILSLALVACGGAPPVKSPEASTAAEEAPALPTAEPESQPIDASPPAEASADANTGKEFKLNASDTAKGAHGAKASKIAPTKTEAAMKFTVVDKEKGPITGIVISLTAPDGTKYYTEETDSEGYAEVLVRAGQKYEVVYLSLGRKEINATVPVSDEPNQNIRLTLRYKRFTPAPALLAKRGAASATEPRFVLQGVSFDTAKATIRAESFSRLDSVVEYMTHRKSARIEISGHTDNVGDAKANKALSVRRAQACRDYLISKGIEGSRIEFVGYGDERPIAPNDTDAGRQENRRIEAKEL